MLVIDCGSQFIIFHLKMTGQLIYTFKKSFLAGGHPIVSTGVTVPNKYTRLVINFNNGGVLYFNDLRKFGWVKLFSKDEYLQLEKKLGLEPLEGDFSLAFFKKCLLGVVVHQSKQSYLIKPIWSVLEISMLMKCYSGVRLNQVEERKV